MWWSLFAQFFRDPYRPLNALLPIPIQKPDPVYRHIDVLPLFVAAGRHLRKDVPAMLDELQQQLASSGKQLTLELHQPIGLEPEMASAISQVVVRKLYGLISQH